MERLYEGKSKIVYAGEKPGTYVIRYKDTATAGNGAKKEELPGKGKLNAAISNLIFGYLAENGVKTHLLQVIDETSILVRSAEIVGVEVVVRNVAAGGFSQKYGVEEGAPLRNTVVEFSCKSDALGDPLMNDSQITAIGLATEAELSQMRTLALRIDELLTSLFARAGIRLIDFKVEFGRADGELLLCDEISPDSCRLWEEKTDRKMDKDRFRRDLGGVLEGYRDVLERLRAVESEG